MDWVRSQLNGFSSEFKGMNARQLIGQGVNLGEWCDLVPPVTSIREGLQSLNTARCAAGLVVTSALIIWKSLMLITGSESPVS